ncbi:hypothetical protein B0P06_004302 [Clostridium saccharoperbutylacetonicum]|uniref:SMEK domain-containing protein n=3 Tax=Clostridium saccharoperbutylacetonicum TaxID=36745 RepID=M1N1N9_9CLOT|nr:SMEK domain-containing protein [Clostridium saccharoperbutylacetonicum]AGF57402.1 hypothetical protein Cspa_c36420 [Clostridium saccharoperbutylacetonicum N1-4(HMT)]NRT61834.1 hypothetical protein [Clostridium saccharoperbutylacetonicum]NSB25160.1 hypothetical protein [Clostridium saccharoperbutylacetonicum]NSB44531.1 hypothetical protein [Clostridium saccharoperbutylacetonicum]
MNTLKREEYINFIVNKLCQLKNEVELQNSINLYNINIIAEDFFRELLNIVYKYNLININSIQKNVSAIDLGDEKNRICIQVTSNNKRNKVQETIDKFLCNEFEKKYDRLIVLLLVNKTKFTKGFDTKNKISFDIKNDILEIKDILKTIRFLDFDRLKEVYIFIKEQFESIEYKKQMKYVDKIMENVDKRYISRYVIVSDKYQQVLMGFEKGVNIYDVFSISSHMLILSDAGSGKSIAAKMVSNYINSHFKESFAFYYRLNTYTGQKIEDLIPNAYKDVPYENMVMIFDGFDEIIKGSINKFVCNIEFFLRNNPQCKVLITTRTNFYNRKSECFSGTIERFTETSLCPLNDESINDYLKLIAVNTTFFWKEIQRNRFYDIVKSPFYLSIIIKLFEAEGRLPPRNSLIKEIIEKSLQVDENKYKNIGFVNDAKDKIYKLLKIIGLALGCIGKNFLTDGEYRKLITKDEERGLVQYCSLWYKTEKNEWCFEHNNFGEFLAAEYLSQCPLNEIQRLVTYENNPDRIKDTWVNTISFLLALYKKDGLFEWIVRSNKELIASLENKRISIKNRENLFKNIFQEYAAKKIWFTDNKNFAKFVESEEIVNYLCENIKNNGHFTIVGSALLILMNLDSLCGQNDRIEKLMIFVCLSNKYRNNEKYYALRLMGKYRLGNSLELKKIIEYNKENENSYLRAGYFNLCNEHNIVDENIEVFLCRYSEVNKGLRTTSQYKYEDTTLFDEQTEFYRGFSLIRQYNTLKRTEEFLLGTERCYRYDEIIKNLCKSMSNVIIIDKRVIDLAYNLFLFFVKHFYKDNLIILIENFDKVNIRKSIFLRYLKERKYRLHDGYYYITDDNCLECFIESYVDGDYDNSIALELINSISGTLIDYERLIKLYEEKTLTKLIKPIVMNWDKIKKDGTRIYFDSLFDKEKFKNLVFEFCGFFHKKLMSHDEIVKMDNNLLRERYDLQHIKRFMLFYLGEKDVFKPEIIEKNWNYIVLSQAHLLITSNNNEIEIIKSKELMLKTICYEFMGKANFRDAIKYYGTSQSTNNLCIYLWFYRDLFDWIYPDDTMLDMLEFDYYKQGKQLGIEYIINILPEVKVKNRILYNLHNRDIRGIIYENHMRYCINKNIDGVVNQAGKVLLNKEKLSTERIISAKYLTIYLKSSDFIKKYLIHLDGDLYWDVLNIAYIKYTDAISDYLILCMRNSADGKNCLYYAKYLIRLSRVEGLKFYYNWMKNNNSPFNEGVYHNNINKAISMIRANECVDTLIKIIELTYEKKFKDFNYDGVQTNAQKALVNIGASSWDNFVEINSKLEKLINDRSDLDDIGFCYYTIQEIEHEYYINIEKECSVEEIMDSIINLEKVIINNKQHSWL